MKCPRCDCEHADDPRSCHWVRAVEYHENGAIKRIEYHGIEGVHTPAGSEKQEGSGLWTVVHKNHPTYLHFSREAAENTRKNLPADLGARVARMVFEGGA